MSAPKRLPRVVLMCLGLFLVGTILAFQAVSPVQAALEFCRTDPILSLSSGTVRLTVAVSASAGNVESIVYTVHAPSETDLLSAVLTGGPLKDKEAIVFDNDSKSGLLETETLVTLRGGRTEVTVNAATEGNASSGTGITGKPVQVQVGLR